MTVQPAAWRSGKSHRDENFPVASRLLHARHRQIILAFYNFVRTADDIADHSVLNEAEKIDLLERLELGLLGKAEDIPEAVALRSALERRKLPPRHAMELLTAFRMDVTKKRYENWDELMHYCRYSAMPVGRFVLDVHGEDRATWPASDPLCAALQIVNHLQDCGEDYRNLDRVYLPRQALAAANAATADLGDAVASPALRKCIGEIAMRASELLDASATLSARIADFRLAMEVSVIQRLARRLIGLLVARDPLSERVHLTAGGFLGVGIVGVIGGAFRRVGRALTPTHVPGRD